MTFRELLAFWRREAESNRARYGEVQASLPKLLETCAADLEKVIREADEEALSLEAAAAESGYHADSLRHMVADGAIPNAGQRGRPRIRRADLPRRAQRTQAGAYSPEQHARELSGPRLAGGRDG